jgi:hypothetical protein
MDVADCGAESVIGIDHAISELAKVDERKARVVDRSSLSMFVR